MSQSLYSLRWNNHQHHMLSSFESLLQNETLVDVTLVCNNEVSIRAHKVVLSACSPFFQKIFSENPCKHPVIVLKDFHGWEVQTIVDFMYKGEVSIGQEQLQTLMKAAESLQVRGLVNQETMTVDKESTTITNQTPTPSNSPSEYERNFFQTPGRFPTPGITVRTPTENSSPFSPIPRYSSEPSPVKLPHMTHIQFPESLLPRRDDCHSPVPRRKQSRPRRRSGELTAPQDLSTTSTPKPTTPTEETAENLCMKKQRTEVKKEEIAKAVTPDPVGSPELDLSLSKEFAHSPPLGLPSMLKMNHDMDSHSPLPFPPMPSVSALTMSQPHSKFFGLDSHLGLFPPGLDGVRNPLLEMADPRTTPDSQLFVKKKSKSNRNSHKTNRRTDKNTGCKKFKSSMKLGRPKGQHSAPRGGPPRSWTNAELTEALQHVWNKKMTTSQASRIFGIPYNSLLMYVRGKYGKSLKLEQLRKDCTGGPVDLMVNNNSLKVERDQDHMQPNTRPSSTEESQQPPVFNPFAPNFYPDFSTGFPIPVSMIHLLPHSEKNSDNYRQQSSNMDGSDISDRSVKEEPQDLFMPPALSRDERRELVQQNGQD